MVTAIPKQGASCQLIKPSDKGTTTTLISLSSPKESFTSKGTSLTVPTLWQARNQLFMTTSTLCKKTTIIPSSLLRACQGLPKWLVSPILTTRITTLRQLAHNHRCTRSSWGAEFCKTQDWVQHVPATSGGLRCFQTCRSKSHSGKHRFISLTRKVSLRLLAETFSIATEKSNFIFFVICVTLNSL